MDSWEWAIIAGVFIGFLLWGPDKVADIARAIGRAKREFDAASRQLANPVEAPASGPGSRAPRTLAPTSPEASSDDVLIATARKLGITTGGKTREEISNEILQTANVSNPPPAPPATLKEKAQRDSQP